MSTLSLNQEFGLMRGRFQRTLTVSIAVHALLLAALVTAHHFAPLPDQVVEITWLEQELPPPVTETAPLPEVRPEPLVEPRVVERPAPELSVKEKLAQNAAREDRVREKLQALQPASVAEKAVSALPATSADLLNAARATMAPVVRNEAPANLNRGATATGPAVALTRGPAAAHKTAAVVAELPVVGGTVSAARPEGAAAVEQNLGGATLGGLVADRRVLTHTMPAYPGWATTQAVEATVTLYFLVMPDGQVKQNVQVRRTAGYQDFDGNAVTAIRQWRFEPLAGAEAREQWGTITFRYRLNN